MGTKCVKETTKGKLKEEVSDKGKEKKSLKKKEEKKEDILHMEIVNFAIKTTVY